MKLLSQFENACHDGKKFLLSQKSLKDAWLNCKDSEWMLWALDRIGYKNDRAIRLFACKCACDTPLRDGRVTYELLTDERSKKAIEVAMLYAVGRATEEERAAARGRSIRFLTIIHFVV